MPGTSSLPTLPDYAPGGFENIDVLRTRQHAIMEVCTITTVRREPVTLSLALYLSALYLSVVDGTRGGGLIVFLSKSPWWSRFYVTDARAFQ